MPCVETSLNPAAKAFELGSGTSGKTLWLVGISSFCVARGRVTELAALEDA